MASVVPTSVPTTDSKVAPAKASTAKFDPKAPSRGRQLITSFVFSRTFQALSIFCLFAALFGIDIAQLAGSQDDGDLTLNILLCFSLGLFTLELVFQSIAEKEYRWSFFFVMDVVGTASLLIDITWIAEALGFNSYNTDASVLRAARAARVGARAGRLTRVMKIVKALQLQNMLTKFMLNRGKNKNQIVSESVDEDTKPSLVGGKIAEALSKKIAALVILMVLLVPGLSVQQTDASVDAFLTQLTTTQSYLAVPPPLGGVPRASEERLLRAQVLDIDTFFADKLSGLSQVPLEIRVKDIFITECTSPLIRARGGISTSNVSAGGGRRVTCFFKWDNNYVSKLRSQDEINFDLKSDPQVVRMKMSLRKSNNEDALWNIMLTIFVLGMLIAFSVLFSMEMSTLVIKPLERIMFVIHASMAQFGKTVQQQSEEEDETDALDRAIAKLTRVMRYVGEGMNNTGQGMLSDAMKNKNLDDKTQAYLKQYVATNDAAAEEEDEDEDEEEEEEQGSARSANGEKKASLSPRDAAGAASTSPLRLQSQEAEKNRRISVASDKTPRLELFGLGQMPRSEKAKLDSWDFDVFEYEAEQLFPLIIVMFDNLDLIQRYQLEPATFNSFLASIAAGYRSENSYHNFHHAADVTHVMYRMLTLSQARSIIGRLDVLAMMVASLAHDIDHPGTNNAFLVATRQNLAIVYNDQSVLENHHCATLYNLLNKPKSNVINALDQVNWVALRRVIIRAILATDNQYHFKHMSELNVFIDLHEDKFAEFGPYCPEVYQKPEDKQLLMDMMLHCCDISNPWKPWKLCEKWYFAIREEFFQQGDLEKEKSLPISPMMDRHTTGKGATSVNFAEFLVAPLLKAICKLLPELNPCLTTLSSNVEVWAGVWKEEMNSKVEGAPGRITDDDERAATITKLDSRLIAFKEKFKPMEMPLGTLTP